MTNASTVASNALCSAESEFFVRRDVHLCKRCLDLLAAGDVEALRAVNS